MQCRIETLLPKKLVGFNTEMSLANNTTPELWTHFKKNEHLIQYKKGTDYFSLQEYDVNYFSNFNPQTKFTKWALMEIFEVGNHPKEMISYNLIGGLYAVFDFKGDFSLAAKVFNFIFMDWLPKSDFVLDNRPHFERLGDKYENNNPNSEEEIWIPVKMKSEL